MREYGCRVQGGVLKDGETFYARKFLNSEQRGGISLVEATIRAPHSHQDQTTTFDATFKIGDCNRIVDLDFGCWDKADIPQIRQKIAVLRRTVIAFEAVLLTQLTELEKT